MREAINNNPKVQIGVIGVLVLVVGLFFMMGMSKKSTPPPAPSASVVPGVSSPTAGGTSAPVTPSPSGTQAPSSPSGSTSVAPSTGGTVTPDALIPGPGLPKNVIDAWNRGDAVVLLIRGGGVDDRLVRSSVQSLRGDRGVSVFVARANNVARYSRITQGVGVEQVPALVVVRPRKESGSIPQAQVSYGFRDSQSVVQAVHDALYNGADNLPYSPR
jgi:hypothetical protein